MSKGVKSNVPRLAIYPEFVQDRMRDFLAHPPPVIRTPELVREQQLVLVADQVLLEHQLDQRGHRDGVLRLLGLHSLDIAVPRPAPNPNEIVFKIQVLHVEAEDFVGAQPGEREEGEKDVPGTPPRELREDGSYLGNRKERDLLALTRFANAEIEVGLLHDGNIVVPLPRRVQNHL